MVSTADGGFQMPMHLVQIPALPEQSMIFVPNLAPTDICDA